ncbi:MAG: ANTAR domain-containing protein, partial [Candidatus Omnitrophica bacterium]|nr:ANTAR domain-containing protein [Candidatus Omnitrophota bacterium]
LEYQRKPNVKAHGSVAGEAMKTKRPVMVYDVREEKKYGFRDLAVKEHLTSMLAVPMVVKDKAIGVINIYTKKIHTFTQEEIDVLQMVANQAAVAVENTHLMKEALKAKEALATRKLIERAKGILMRLSNSTEEEAHKLIHKKSMDSCKTMKEISESIILMDELQKGK